MMISLFLISVCIMNSYLWFIKRTPTLTNKVFNVIHYVMDHDLPRPWFRFRNGLYEDTTTIFREVRIGSLTSHYVYKGTIYRRMIYKHLSSEKLRILLNQIARSYIKALSMELRSLTEKINMIRSTLGLETLSYYELSGDDLVDEQVMSTLISERRLIIARLRDTSERCLF